MCFHPRVENRGESGGEERSDGGDHEAVGRGGDQCAGEPAEGADGHEYRDRHRPRTRPTDHPDDALKASVAYGEHEADHDDGWEEYAQVFAHRKDPAGNARDNEACGQDASFVLALKAPSPRNPGPSAGCDAHNDDEERVQSRLHHVARRRREE